MSSLVVVEWWWSAKSILYGNGHHWKTTGKLLEKTGNP